MSFRQALEEIAQGVPFCDTHDRKAYAMIDGNLGCEWYSTGECRIGVLHDGQRAKNIALAALGKSK